MSYIDDFDEKELYNKINRELRQSPRNEELPLQSGYDDPVIDPDAPENVYPDQDPTLTPEGSRTLRDRLQDAYMLQGGIDVSRALRGATGKGSDAGVAQLEKELSLRDKLELAKSKGTINKSQKTNTYIRKGKKHEGVDYGDTSIAWDPVRGEQYITSGKGKRLYSSDAPKLFQDPQSQERVRHTKLDEEFKREQLGINQKKLDLSTKNYKLSLLKDRRPSPSVQNAITSIDTLMADMDAATSVFSNPDMPSGLISGSKNWAAQKLNLDDPNISKAYAMLGMNLANYLKDRSGAAVSEKERKFLAGITPSEFDKKATLLKKIEMVKEYMRRKRAAIENAQAQLGKHVTLDKSHAELLNVKTDDLQEQFEGDKEESKVSGKDPGPRPTDPAEVPAWRKKRIEYLKSRR